MTGGFRMTLESLGGPPGRLLDFLSGDEASYGSSPINIKCPAVQYAMESRFPTPFATCTIEIAAITPDITTTAIMQVAVARRNATARRMAILGSD